MAIQGERLYWLALVGCALSVLTYSWEAGVLGGVQLTEPFQEAMHVRNMSMAIRLVNRLVNARGTETFRHDCLHDLIRPSPGVFLRQRGHRYSRYDVG